MKASIFNLDASNISKGIMPILVLDPENVYDGVVVEELKRRKLCSNNEELFEIVGMVRFLLKKSLSLLMIEVLTNSDKKTRTKMPSF